MKGQDLLNYRHWAVVGDTENPSKWAHAIVGKLRGEGYSVVCVNPRGGSDGFKSLKEAVGTGEKIEVIDLVINPKAGYQIVKDAVELGIDKILIQPGASSPEIIGYCADHGISAVETCVLVELAARR